EDLPCFVMGNGSNLLVSDDGYRGAIIRIGKRMGKIEVRGESIYAEAGALLSQIASAALENSLCGFEFAGGIPGSLGGACVMNAGAYGGEMKQVLREVSCLDEDDELLVMRGDELGLGYRTSVFMKRPMTVVGAVIELKKGDRGAIAAKMDDLRSQRQSKQPLDIPSAGSTFKRPEGYFAGKLIMDAGLKGFTIGGAQVSEKHCGFIVNRGGASASDVAELIRYVRDTVEKQFGVRLETEVRFIGKF
ncbi:MAG: UDP-N-acetylmuramate dehydrogenase, partial [Lachnospiraceae bacterium]|nr:UDP-N-acetylmuramate dehydrogenase [Lachnospiraceae bacterium]